MIVPVSIVLTVTALILWAISIEPMQDFCNEFLKIKRFRWFWKIVTYTPIINSIAFLLVFVIGIFAVLVSLSGNPVKGIKDKNKI